MLFWFFDVLWYPKSLPIINMAQVHGVNLLNSSPNTQHPLGLTHLLLPQCCCHNAGRSSTLKRFNFK